MTKKVSGPVSRTMASGRYCSIQELLLADDTITIKERKRDTHKKQAT